MDINTFIRNYRGQYLCPRVVCADGFSISIQAGSGHYCSPRVDELVANTQYTHVELGFPSHFEKIEEILLDYCEDKDCPTGTVYGYVPVEVVQEVLDKHGGIKWVVYDETLIHVELAPLIAQDPGIIENL